MCTPLVRAQWGDIALRCHSELLTCWHVDVALGAAAKLACKSSHLLYFSPTDPSHYTIYYVSLGWYMLFIYLLVTACILCNKIVPHHKLTCHTYPTLYI